MSSFAKAAPYLTDPLVLVGFALFLFFGLCRYLLQRGIIPPLGKTHGFRIVRLILLYGFVLGLSISALGFGLKYKSISEAEQKRAVAVLRAELQANSQLVSQLSANLTTVVNIYDSLTTQLRDNRFHVLKALFPAANLRRELTNPTARELALAALSELQVRGLDRNTTELEKADAAGRLIVDTIERTLPTIRSLGDTQHTRYIIRRSSYEAQLPFLRRIDIVNATDLPSAYADLDRVRANYDVVIANQLAYLGAIKEFFQAHAVNESTLTKVLTAERLATAILMEFTPTLVEAGEALRIREQALEAFQ